MEKQLTWPLEATNAHSTSGYEWNQAGSNICLDFHGDPLNANLVVFSDGNHHMALEECCQLFNKNNPEVNDIFYATTPPTVILESVLNGGVQLGNLKINRLPHVFISPRNILEQLRVKKYIESHQAFAQSKKTVLLVKKGNPKDIQSINDLLRKDVTFAISNPITEAASYNAYKKSLINAVNEHNLDLDVFNNLVAKDSTDVVFGQSIHHREVPQTIFSSRADVAIVYYHLALRYTRIFPNDFEFIEFESNPIDQTSYHIGLMNNSGDWGDKFVTFMTSAQAINIYKSHGLQACN